MHFSIKRYLYSCFKDHKNMEKVEKRRHRLWLPASMRIHAKAYTEFRFAILFRNCIMHFPSSEFLHKLFWGRWWNFDLILMQAKRCTSSKCFWTSFKCIDENLKTMMFHLVCIRRIYLYCWVCTKGRNFSQLTQTSVDDFIWGQNTPTPQSNNPLYSIRNTYT